MKMRKSTFFEEHDMCEKQTTLTNRRKTRSEI